LPLVLFEPAGFSQSSVLQYCIDVTWISLDSFATVMY